MVPFALAVLCCAGGPAAAPPPIVLDGRFEEWAQRTPLVIDPADAGKGGIDLGMVTVAEEPAAVHWFVELGRTVNLQRLPGRLVLAIDQDGLATTGDTQHGLDGADLIVVFTPPSPKDPAKPGVGVAVRRFVDGVWQETTPYDQPVAFAPTAAARNAEIRIGRDATTLAGDSFRFRLVAYDADGGLRDEIEPMTVPLATRPAPAASLAGATDPLARLAGTALRVVSWNVERGAPFKSPERFGRVLRALRPDVILFSELTDKQGAEGVREWLEANVPDAAASPAGGGPDSATGPTANRGAAAAWSVVFGSGGGDLRTAVAARRPIATPPGLERLLWSDDAGAARDVRFASGVIEVDGRRLLACAVHLKCCGHAGSDEDLTRLEETQAVRAALRTARFGDLRPGQPAGAGSATTGRFDALVIGGDYNLVGSFEPLELMIEGLDVDGSNLAVAAALQLDARTSATWADAAQPFTPGQLDYLVFSDSVLRQVGGFVVDTSDLSATWLERHGLQPDDTSEASDHLPVVIDLGWR